MLLELWLVTGVHASVCVDGPAQMAAALHSLHSQGMAHMDLKPDNIYTTLEEGGFKLGDFGQAVPVKLHSGINVAEGDARCVACLSAFVPVEVCIGANKGAWPACLHVRLSVWVSREQRTLGFPGCSELPGVRPRRP
jgi:serine/threonine protein kinase